MDVPTLKRLGRILRNEIVPLHELPFPMREALRRLAEKYDRPELSVLEGGHGEAGPHCEHDELIECVETPLSKR